MEHQTNSAAQIFFESSGEEVEEDARRFIEKMKQLRVGGQRAPSITITLRLRW